MYFIKSKTVKFRCFQQPVVIINFVHYQKNRLIGFPKHLCHCFIQIGNARSNVYHKNDYIGFFQRNQYLLANFFFKYIFTFRNKSSRINHVKRFSVPFCYAVLPVSCYAADIIYDSFALLQHTVKKSALANIWPAYNGYCKTHKYSSSAFKSALYKSVSFKDLFIFIKSGCNILITLDICYCVIELLIMICPKVC